MRTAVPDRPRKGRSGISSDAFVSFSWLFEREVIMHAQIMCVHVAHRRLRYAMYEPKELYMTGYRYERRMKAKDDDVNGRK